MLELTRRMTPSRNCFSRIAGAYMDEEGYEDGTFNIHFGNDNSSILLHPTPLSPNGMAAVL